MLVKKTAARGPLLVKINNMAAADAKVDTIYVLSQYQDNKPVEGSQRVLPIARYGGQ
jgi:hypothetical protein